MDGQARVSGTSNVLGSVMLYLRTAHTAHGPGDTRSSLAMQVLCIFAMALLFRVLSTTAEDYFSPILTQMSKDFYLPPRLAGGEGLHSNRPLVLVRFLLAGRHTVFLRPLLPRRVDTVHCLCACSHTDGVGQRRTRHLLLHGGCQGGRVCAGAGRPARYLSNLHLATRSQVLCISDTQVHAPPELQGRQPGMALHLA